MPAGGPIRRPERWTLLAIAVAAAAAIAQARFGYFSHPRAGHAFGSEDAYISYRYAWNFFQHRGLVFNPSERVEGFSNLLYTLMVAPGFFLVDHDSIFWWSLALNLAAWIATLWLFARFVAAKSGAQTATLAVWVLALCPVLWMWTAAGLETPFVLLLQIGMWIAVDGENDASPAWLATLAIASVLIRPDGGLIPAAGAAYLWVSGRRRQAWWIAGATALTVAGVTAWRLSYYGAWLPNTYYVKVTGRFTERASAALHQLWQIAPGTGLLLALTLGLGVPLAVIAVMPVERRSTWWRYPAFFLSVVIAYWIYIGGDVYEDRFLVVVFPIGVYAGLRLLRALGAERAAPALAALLIVSQLGALNALDERFALARHRYDSLEVLGRYLREHEPNRVLAIGAAGKVPYWSGLYTIDMFGLADATIAREAPRAGFAVGHSKYDNDYVLARHPDLIAGPLFYSPPGGGDLDLSHGLTRAVYQAAGYRLKYLVNHTPIASRQDILDADLYSTAELERFARGGYGYAVLARDTVPRTATAASAISR